LYLTSAMRIALLSFMIPPQNTVATAPTTPAG
jgi:hypothetical protein